MAMSTDTAAPTNPPKADVPHEVVVTCPATGKVVGRVPVATSVEVEAVAARLRAAQPAWQRTGIVNINNVLAFQFPAPMEGWNDSGLGSRSGGADGIRKYYRTKSIVAERVTMKKEPLWYPYSRKKGKIIAAMLRMTSAKDWRRRLGR
jgi:acyl-CoA reductase-like NAD-dependent aldehyde dehydrogenase